MSRSEQRLQPQLRAVPMTLFPTMGSLSEVVDHAESSLPVDNANQMFAILMAYHNTLLKKLGIQPNATQSGNTRH